MTHPVRMEGLTLTVVDVAVSADYYCNKLGLFKLEWNAAPQFAMLRVNDGAATLRLLAWAEAEKEGAERLSHAQARAVHVEFSTDDLDFDCPRVDPPGVNTWLLGSPSASSIATTAERTTEAAVLPRVAA